MKTKSLSAIIVLLTGGILAHAQSSPAAKSAAGSLPANDVVAIRDASKNYTKLALARDWSNWSRLFAEEAIFMVPNEPPRNGRKNIEAWANTFPVLKELTIEPHEFHGRGDLAFVRGKYSFVIAAANQPEVRDVGKYIEVWRKQSDGSWKLFRDIFNSDLPMPPADAKNVAARKAVWEKKKAGVSMSGAGTLSARDRDAIRAAWTTCSDAIKAKDWARVATIIRNDAAILRANAPALDGWAEIDAWQKQFPPSRDWRAEPLEIGGHGDVAYLRGQWSIIMTPPNEPEQPDAGKYLQIWTKHADGSWKLFRDIWNSDLPVH